MQPLGALLIHSLGRTQLRRGWRSAAASWAPGASAEASGSTCSSASGGAAAPGAQWWRSSFSMASPTRLDEVMHVDQLRDKTADEIEQIWMEFHQDPSFRRVADVMSADEYKQLQARARSSPLFVLPLAKPGGFMTLLLNYQAPLALLTSVEEYRQFGAGAPPHMTITHYTELADSKGVVLTRGDIINDAVVNMAEGRTLLQLARAFYTDPEAHRMVYQFNHEQDKFSFDALLQQLGHKGAAAAGGGQAREP